jgi:hypothetical protein
VVRIEGQAGSAGVGGTRRIAIEQELGQCLGCLHGLGPRSLAPAGRPFCRPVLWQDVSAVGRERRAERPDRERGGPASPDRPGIDHGSLEVGQVDSGSAGQGEPIRIPLPHEQLACPPSGARRQLAPQRGQRHVQAPGRRLGIRLRPERLLEDLAVDGSPRVEGEEAQDGAGAGLQP